MLALISFLVILSVLVLIHEAGHYVAARMFGVKADEFGFGFPPRAIGIVKTKSGWKKVSGSDRGEYPNTIWSFNWLPLGGFVRIKGEQGDGEFDPDSFHMKPIWQRVVILAAGVTMNWILAIALFATVFTVGTNMVLEDLPSNAHVTGQSIRITQVLPGAPADTAGLKPNDVIVSVDGVASTGYEQVRDSIAQHGTTPFHLQIQRDGITQDVAVTPAFVAEVGRPALGIGLADVGHVTMPPLTAIRVGAITTYGYTKLILVTLGDLVRTIVMTRSISSDLSGPVGIAVMSGQIAQEGIIPLLQFAAILSINLAVVNFLPIPALDGGRVLFLVIEKLRRRAMSRKLEATIHNVAFVVLISLILLVTIHDISKYGGVIVGGIRGLVGM